MLLFVHVIGLAEAGRCVKRGRIPPNSFANASIGSFDSLALGPRKGVVGRPAGFPPIAGSVFRFFAFLSQPFQSQAVKRLCNRLHRFLPLTLASLTRSSDKEPIEIKISKTFRGLWVDLDRERPQCECEHLSSPLLLHTMILDRTIVFDLLRTIRSNIQPLLSLHHHYFAACFVLARSAPTTKPSLVFCQEGLVSLYSLSKMRELEVTRFRGGNTGDFLPEKYITLLL